MRPIFFALFASIALVLPALALPADPVDPKAAASKNDPQKAGQTNPKGKAPAVKPNPKAPAQKPDPKVPAKKNPKTCTPIFKNRIFSVVLSPYGYSEWKRYAFEDCTSGSCAAYGFVGVP